MIATRVKTQHGDYAGQRGARRRGMQRRIFQFAYTHISRFSDITIITMLMCTERKISRTVELRRGPCFALEAP